MTIPEHSELLSFLRTYLEETDKFEKEKLIPWDSFTRKQSITNENLIVHIANHESKLKN